MTCKWDEFLQQEGHTMPDWKDNENLDDCAEDLEDEIEVKKEQALVAELDESSDEAGDKDDFLVADEGEELDEDIWAEEGYDAL